MLFYLYTLFWFLKIILLYFFLLTFQQAWLNSFNFLVKIIKKIVLTIDLSNFSTSLVLLRTILVRNCIYTFCMSKFRLTLSTNKVQSSLIFKSIANNLLFSVNLLSTLNAAFSVCSFKRVWLWTSFRASNWLVFVKCLISNALIELVKSKLFASWSQQMIDDSSSLFSKFWSTIKLFNFIKKDTRIINK